ENPHHSYQQMAHRRLEIQTSKHAVEHPPGPPTDRESDDQDDDRNENFRAELHTRVDGRVLDVVQCFEIVHRLPSGVGLRAAYSSVVLRRYSRTSKDSRACEPTI